MVLEGYLNWIDGKIISKLLHSNRRINNGLKTVKLWLLFNIILT